MNNLRFEQGVQTKRIIDQIVLTFDVVRLSILLRNFPNNVLILYFLEVKNKIVVFIKFFKQISITDVVNHR